jgi:raffinose/stachyose/melibiose transport system substrate-binding protein
MTHMGQGTWRWATLASLSVAAALIVGCGGGGGSGGSPGGSEGKGTVVLWDEMTGGEAKAMKAVINDFTASSGVKVRERSIDNENFFTVIRTGMSGSNPPDVVQYEGYQQTRDFAKAKRLEDLTDFWNKNKSKFDLPELAETACRYEGRIYCVPFNYGRLFLYYNQKLLDQHGIKAPKTWEDFVAAGEKLKQANVVPVALGSKDGWTAAHWYFQTLAHRCGSETVYKAVNREGAKWTDPCFVQAGEDVADLAKRKFFPPGVTSDDYAAQTALFTAGKAAFMLTGNWFISSWSTSPLPFKAGVVGAPSPSDAEHPDDVVGQPIYVIGVPSKSKNKAQALKFLEGLSDPATAKRWSDPGNTSMVKGAVESSKAPKLIKDLWAESRKAPGSIPFLENELPPAMGEDVIYNGATALTAGRMSAQEYAKSIESAAEQYQAK